MIVLWLSGSDLVASSRNQYPMVGIANLQIPLGTKRIFLNTTDSWNNFDAADKDRAQDTVLKDRGTLALSWDDRMRSRGINSA